MEKHIKRMIVAFMSLGIICSILNIKQHAIDATSTPIVKNYGLHHSDGADRYSWMADVKSMYTTYASPTAKVTNYNYFTRSTLYDGLNSANYLNIHTHGAFNSTTSTTYGLVCIDSSGNRTDLTLAAVNNYSSGIFSNLKVCFLGACQSAGIHHNMALAVKNHGAACTIGYQETVDTKCNYNTIAAFNLGFATANKTVANAMSAAIAGTYTKYGQYGETDSYQIYGNSSLTYN